MPILQLPKGDLRGQLSLITFRSVGRLFRGEHYQDADNISVRFFPDWLVNSATLKHARQWSWAIRRLHDIPFAAARKEFVSWQRRSFLFLALFDSVNRKQDKRERHLLNPFWKTMPPIRRRESRTRSPWQISMVPLPRFSLQAPTL